MTTFDYTDTERVYSSAVDEVFYNRETEELAVDLHDDVYVYSGVPLDRYERLVSADSVGRAYREIKLEFGPARYLGDCEFVDYNEVEIAPTPVVPSTSQTVGTPKGLRVTENTIIHNDNTGLVSLAPATAQSPSTRKHTVVFVANGAERRHTLNVASVDEAVAAVLEIAEMLDLEFRVREVVVHFE